MQPEREHGFDLLAQVRKAALQDRITRPQVDIQTAECKAHTGDIGAAI